MRRAGVVASLAFVWLSACGKDETASNTKPIVPPPPTFVSGTRLRAMFLEVDDLKVHVGWQDSKLGRPCAFTEGRCLPGTTRLVADGDESFEDDACTKPIVSVEGEIDSLMFVAHDGACTTAALRSLGDRIPAPAQVYGRVGGKCIPTSAFPAVAEYIRVGDVIAPEAEPYVHATEQNDASDGRIVVRWLVADDGARQIASAWDNERSEIVEVAPGGKRWYPRDRATVLNDSTCSGIATSSACKPSVVFVGGDACREPSIASLGAPADLSACGSFYATAGYEIGRPIANTSFVEARTVVVGSGRVRLAMDARDDSRPIVPRALVDTEGETTCDPVTSADGSIQCLPRQDSRITGVFSDPGCTQKAILFTPGAGACDLPPVVPHFVLRQNAYFEVGPRIESAWTEDSTGACMPVEASGDRTAYAATPLDPSRLPVLTLRTE